ncbi:MAG: RIP metalloprotease RseP [Desulfuromonas sp.]|nr:MAG: RIP metalloprotease RseP [Desulfuromonas sp.]
MITLFSGIIMLGVLVFVHELGHFCVAKFSGVKVLKFSLGFGPKLFSRQWGETEYLICAIPLGGYVQMLGEGGGEQGESAEMTEEESRRSFANKPLLNRTAIVAAGPVMNLALPFLLLPLTFLIGVNLPAYLDREPCIGHVVEETPGSKAGIQAGDCIISVNDVPVETWTKTNQTLISQVGQEIFLTVMRDGKSRQVLLEPWDDDLEKLQLQELGLMPHQAALIGAISKGFPAESAGMKVGDRIVAIGGQPVTSWYDLRTLIQAGEGTPLSFDVERDGELVSLSIKPVLNEQAGGYLVGISPQPESYFKRFGLKDAVIAGADQAMDIISLTVVFIQKLFTGHVSSKNIGGPIMVFQMAGQAAQTDFATVLTMLAFLSIQLGILNLLPIPILDGGHLFFYLFEFVFRRPLSNRAREMMQQVGLAMIVLLMVLAFYNDLARIFFGGQ